VRETICEVGVAREQLLSLAATAEKHSTHPIARSIVAAYESEFGSATANSDNIEEILGRGIIAVIDSKKLIVGNYSLMKENGIVELKESQPCTDVEIHVALGGQYLGKILVSDKEKSNVKVALASLRHAGIKKTVMLTGDRSLIAKKVSEDLGIDEYRAELLPADKVTALENLIAAQKGSGKLIFVGDGINDAPVLARADVGIAMGALGSDAAIESADVVLMNDDIGKISEAILLSRRTRRIVIENIAFALSVKISVLILGACGLVGLNSAVFADVGVAVIAILNSMRNLKK
jgi:Cd2+/Zn2+-exporting ATPase